MTAPNKAVASSSPNGTSARFDAVGRYTTRRYIGERVLAELLNDPEAAGLEREFTPPQKLGAIVLAAVVAWVFAVGLAYVLIVGLMLVLPS